MRHFCLAVYLLVGLLAASAGADTYYVDPTNGRDGGDGSEVNPWKTLEQVANSGGLNRVTPGSTVLLRSGYHGAVRFSGNNRETITIAADKDHTPQLSQLEIPSGSNWHIRGLSISPSFGEGGYRGAIVNFADGGASTDIIIEDCFIFTEADSSNWDVPRWMSANTGINMGRHGKGLILRNNYVLNTRFGINLNAEDSICEGNVVSHFSGDGIRVTRDGIIVRQNVIKNNWLIRH